MKKVLILPGLVKAGNGLNMQHIFGKSYHSYHINLYWTLQHNENWLQLLLDFIANCNSGIHLSHLFKFKWLIHYKMMMLNNARCMQRYIYMQTKLCLPYKYIQYWISVHICHAYQAYIR